MQTPDDLNRRLEEVTGVSDVLCIDAFRISMPYFGAKSLPNHGKGAKRLDFFLEKEGVEICRVDLRRAIDFLMPSTTDFGRSFVGRDISRLVDSPDPKVVSLACSTGLEVYWIIHFLKEAGLLTERGKVYGVDINAEAIKEARKCEYEKFLYDFKRCYFEEDAQKGLIIDAENSRVSFDPRLKPHAEFLVGNILDLQQLRGNGLGDMDVVSMMNVLKYMNKDSKWRAVTTAYKLLKTGGILYTDAWVPDDGCFQVVEGCLRAYRKIV